MSTVPKSDRITIVTLASASAGPFDLTFRLFDDDGLAVFVNDLPRTDFTISSTYVEGFDDEASVTFADNLAIGDVIRIHGDLVPDRQDDYVDGPGLTPKLNIELGRVWSALSELKRDANRSFKLFQSVSPIAIEVGKVLIGNPSGNGLGFGPTITDIASAQEYASTASGKAGEAAASAAQAAGTAQLVTVISLTGAAIVSPYTLPFAPVSQGLVSVNVDGIEQFQSQFTIDEDELTFTDGWPVDAGEVEIKLHSPIQYSSDVVYDSELTDIAAVKGLNQGVSSTDSPVFVDLTLTSALDFQQPDPARISVSENGAMTYDADFNNTGAGGTSHAFKVDGKALADFNNGGYLRFNKSGFAAGGICNTSTDSGLFLGGGSNPVNSGINVSLSGPSHALPRAGFSFRDGTSDLFGWRRSGDFHYWSNDNVEAMRLVSGRLGIGAAPAAGVVLDISSTTAGVRHPRMTTTQMNALTAIEGLEVWNSTLKKKCVYNGTAWQSLDATNV